MHIIVYNRAIHLYIVVSLCFILSLLKLYRLQSFAYDQYTDIPLVLDIVGLVTFLMSLTYEISITKLMTKNSYYFKVKLAALKIVLTYGMWNV